MPVAQDAYRQMADAYAAKIDTKPHNAYYEMPAMLALMPEVAGLRALDAGCGTGRYTAWLLARGAAVVGVDASPEMLHHARQRVGERVELHLADMDQPLAFLPDATFDLVVSGLAIHYIANLNALFAEFARALKPGGLFVFSTGHPFGDYLYFRRENYFETAEVGADWGGFAEGRRIHVRSYYVPLQTITDALWRSGFVIERLIEPRPTEEFRRADPDDYEKLMKTPGFLCVRARKPLTPPRKGS